jgi:hypothetical protein
VYPVSSFRTIALAQKGWVFTFQFLESLNDGEEKMGKELVFFIQKNVNKTSKILVGGPGSRNNFSDPDPGVKKAQELGS